MYKLTIKLVLLAAIFSNSINLFASSSSELSYITFDKVLFGIFNCSSPDYPRTNIACHIRNRHQNLNISGWKRISSTGENSETSDTVSFVELNASFYMSDSSVEHFYHGLDSCLTAINLVKSNPIKWDLRIGIDVGNWSNRLYSCEAINSDLMKQYHAEKQI